MATIAPTFDLQARDLDKDYARETHPASGIRPTPAEFHAARVRYELAHKRITLHFSQALAHEYAVDLPTIIQDSIFQKAWADGQDTGYAEVEMHYQDLANLANEVWVVATQEATR